MRGKDPTLPPIGRKTLAGSLSHFGFLKLRSGAMPPQQDTRDCAALSHAFPVRKADSAAVREDFRVAARTPIPTPGHAPREARAPAPRPPREARHAVRAEGRRPRTKERPSLLRAPRTPAARRGLSSPGPGGRARPAGLGGSGALSPEPQEREVRSPQEAAPRDPRSARRSASQEPFGRLRGGHRHALVTSVIQSARQ
jgi:hypothetical protein